MSKIGLHYHERASWQNPEWGGPGDDDPEKWIGHVKPATSVLVLNGLDQEHARRVVAAGGFNQTRFFGRLGGRYDRLELHGRALQADLRQDHSIIATGNEGEGGTWPEPTWDTMTNPEDVAKLLRYATNEADYFHGKGWQYVASPTFSYGAVEQMLGWYSDVDRDDGASRNHVKMLQPMWEAVDVVAINTYKWLGVRTQWLDYRLLHRLIWEECGLYRPIIIQEMAWMPVILYQNMGHLVERYIPVLEEADAEWRKDRYLLGVNLWDVGSNWGSKNVPPGGNDLTREAAFLPRLAERVILPSPREYAWPKSVDPTPTPPPPDPTPGKTIVKVPGWMIETMMEALGYYHLTEYAPLLSAIWHRESGWHPYARGDWVDGEPTSFGPGQVNRVWLEHFPEAAKINTHFLIWRSVRVLVWCMEYFTGYREIAMCYKDGTDQSRWHKGTFDYGDQVLDYIEKYQWVPLP